MYSGRVYLQIYLGLCPPAALREGYTSHSRPAGADRGVCRREQVSQRRLACGGVFVDPGSLRLMVFHAKKRSEPLRFIAVPQNAWSCESDHCSYKDFVRVRAKMLRAFLAEKVRASRSRFIHNDRELSPFLLSPPGLEQRHSSWVAHSGVVFKTSHPEISPVFRASRPAER